MEAQKGHLEVESGTVVMELESGGVVMGSEAGQWEQVLLDRRTVSNILQSVHSYKWPSVCFKGERPVMF